MSNDIDLILTWHDDPENYQRQRGNYDQVYRILDRYLLPGENPDGAGVDVLLYRASEDDLQKCASLLNPDNWKQEVRPDRFEEEYPTIEDETERFLIWHDDMKNYERQRNNYDRLYRLLDRYATKDENPESMEVDILFNRMPEDEKQMALSLIDPRNWY